MKAFLESLFGQKYYLAPPGYDPTVDPLPAALSNRRAGGGGGVGTWLLIGLMTAGLVGVIWFSISKLRPSAPAMTATVEPLSTVTLAFVGVEGVSRRPTRTPLVWPTIGVMSVTEATGAPVNSPSPSVSPVSTLAGTRPPSTFTPLPTPNPPTQTPRVIYSNGQGGPGPTQLVYVTAPPLPTYTPQPTYTPLPTYTLVPDTPTPTLTPTATATCPAPVEAGPLPDAPYRLYFPLVAVDGEGRGQGCTP